MGPAATAVGPLRFSAGRARGKGASPLAAALAVLLAAAALTRDGAAADWVPPRPVSAWLPGATIAPGNAATLELVLRAEGVATSLEWTATASGQFVPNVTPSSGAVVVPANGIVRIPLSVAVPPASQGLGTISLAVVHANGGGRVATANASITAAADGRPEIWPVSPTWSATGGTHDSVGFHIRSQIAFPEDVVLTGAVTNPDPNNQGALFEAGPMPSSVLLPAGGTVTVGVPVTLAGNAWAGNANTVQMSVTSNEGLSAATAHALIETAIPDSLPLGLRPVGLMPTAVPPTGRDGPVSLTDRGAWLLPAGTEGIRVWRASAVDSIGITDTNVDGADDRLIGTIRIPSLAAGLAVVPGFVTASAETLDLGLVAAGRQGLIIVDLRVIEDPTFGAWEDFFDQNADGVDDRVVRTIPMAGFATDVAWTRSPAGRVVAFVAAADSGSSPVSPFFDPMAVIAGSGDGVVAVDVTAVIDSLSMLPVVVGAWNTPGGAFDVELREGDAGMTLAVADGAAGLSIADIAIAAGAPAAVTFTPRPSTPLPGNWGTPYARDVAWLPLTGSTDYVVIAAGAGGLHIARVPPSGPPTVVLAQQGAGEPCAVATTWPGLIAVGQNAAGVALFQAPVASQLDLATAIAAPPYTAPVLVARGGSWPGGVPLEQAAFASPAGGATSLAFGSSGNPIPEVFVSDRSRMLVLRPGSLTITGVASEHVRTPPVLGRVRLDVMPNPSSGRCVVRARAIVTEAATEPSLLHADTRIEIVDVRGRIVRVLTASGNQAVNEIHREWDGRDGQGRRVASGRYWARVRTRHPLSGVNAPLVIIR